MKYAAIIGLAALAAACATPVGGAPTPAGPGGVIPRGEVDLGNWRNASAAATLGDFERNISMRYGAGLALRDVSADLRRNEFNCGAAPPRTTDGRGDPPAQVCRRTITLSGCTHTWQVHLFDADDDGLLARTRGLYDRRCGDDGLLGGPG